MIAQVTDWADSTGAVRTRSPFGSVSSWNVLTQAMLSGAVRPSKRKREQLSLALRREADAFGTRPLPLRVPREGVADRVRERTEREAGRERLRHVDTVCCLPA